MRKPSYLYFLFVAFFYGGLNLNCNSQVANHNVEKEKLSLVSKIILPNVNGRIDHIAYDSIHHLAFIAALGNNTVEVVDVNKDRVVKTIGGLREPQGVLYIPSSDRIVVANGDNGDCVFFDGRDYSPLGVVHLKDDADNIRYDPLSQLVYVGYGSGAIAIIDPTAVKQIANITLDDHPESFQLSKKRNRIYINVPGANEIEVGDLSTNKVIAKWKNSGASSNFPMALDEKSGRLFVGCRSPAKLRMINAETGKDISVVSISADADDIFYSNRDSLVFVSAGRGFIDVFRTDDRQQLQVNHIETSSGARTSLLLAHEKRFLLAVPAHAGNPAALWIYSLD